MYTPVIPYSDAMGLGILAPGIFVQEVPPSVVLWISNSPPTGSPIAIPVTESVKQVRLANDAVFVNILTAATFVHVAPASIVL